MKAIFADSFYYIALLNPADQFHGQAIEASRNLSRPVLTTTWVLMEVADALSSPGYRQLVHRMVRELFQDPNTTVLPLDQDSFLRGLEFYGQRHDKSWSLTDCISFTIMSDRGIHEALTGDRHFVQAGFLALMMDAPTED